MSPRVPVFARSSLGLPGRHLPRLVVTQATVCLDRLQSSHEQVAVPAQREPFTWVAFIHETLGKGKKKGFSRNIPTTTHPALARLSTTSSTNLCVRYWRRSFYLNGNNSQMQISKSQNIPLHTKV